MAVMLGQYLQTMTTSNSALNDRVQGLAALQDGLATELRQVPDAALQSIEGRMEASLDTLEGRMEASFQQTEGRVK